MCFGQDSDPRLSGGSGGRHPQIWVLPPQVELATYQYIPLAASLWTGLIRTEISLLTTNRYVIGCDNNVSIEKGIEKLSSLTQDIGNNSHRCFI